MVWIITDRSFNTPESHRVRCRCGNPALEDEACNVCEQMVCAACAAFIDPRSRRQERPSHLMARGITRDFLAHHACLGDTNPRMTAMIETRDVPSLVRVLRQHGPHGIDLIRERRLSVPRELRQSVEPALVRSKRD